MKDQQVYLLHILECLEKIEGYPAGIDESRFLESTLIQDA